MTNKKELLRIPTPDETEDGYVFYPIVRVSRVVPFGYMQDPEDPDMLLPVEKELILFEEAKKHLKQYSLRDVAAWLSAKSGRYISHVGLRTRVMQEQKQAKELIDAKAMAKRFYQAYKKAKRIQASRLGKKAPTDEEINQELFSRQSETCED